MAKSKKAAPKSATKAKAVAKKEVAREKLTAKAMRATSKRQLAEETVAADVGTDSKLAVKVNEAVIEVKTKKKRGKKAATEQLDASELNQKWNSLYRKAQENDAKPYNMKHTYEPKTPIVHKLLGWGYILNNKNDRLEVLFKDGVRFLISNYKA